MNTLIKSRGPIIEPCGNIQLYALGSSPINVDEVKKTLSDYPDQNIAHSITHHHSQK